MSSPVETVADILPSSGTVALGRNWWEVESVGSTRFRWARSGAEILVAALRPVRYALRLLVEPGPGVGVKPFTLQAFDVGAPLATVEVVGKQNIRIDLPPGGPKVYRIELRAERGGTLLPGDLRAMDFRAFEINVEAGERDVLPPTMKLGMGWYPLEAHKGLTFRWVNNNAEISLSNPSGKERLEFDVEPGPNQEAKPLRLSVLRREGTKDSSLAEIEVLGRQRVDLPLPKADRLDLLLHVDIQGSKVGGETRVLSFRLFQYPGA